MKARILGIGSQLLLAALLSTVAAGQEQAQPGQGRGGFNFTPPDPAKVAEANEKLMGILDEVLEPKGMDRLLGLYVQDRGAQGVLNDLVAKKINITDDQKKSLTDELQKVAEAQSKKMRELFPQFGGGGGGPGGRGPGGGGPGAGGPGGGGGPGGPGGRGGFGGFGGGFGGGPMGRSQGAALDLAGVLRMEEVRKEIGLGEEGYNAIREVQRELFAGMFGGRGPGGGGQGGGGQGDAGRRPGGGRGGDQPGGERPRGGDQPGGNRPGGDRPGAGSETREAFTKLREESTKLNDEAVAKVLDDAQEKALTDLKGAKFEFPENRGFGGFGGSGGGQGGGRGPGGRGGAGGRPAGDNT